MIEIQSKCITEESGEIIVRRENKSSIKLSNPNHQTIKCIQVDGCVISDKGDRCDWLFSYFNDANRIFVELKGSDIVHAIEQIWRSIELIGKGENKTNAYVIFSSSYPSNNTIIQNKKKQFYKKHKITVDIKNVKNNTITL